MITVLKRSKKTVTYSKLYFFLKQRNVVLGLFYDAHRFNNYSATTPFSISTQPAGSWKTVSILECYRFNYNIWNICLVYTNICIMDATVTVIHRPTDATGATVHRTYGGSVDRWTGERWTGETGERWTGETGGRWTGETGERWTGGTSGPVDGAPSPLHP
jgi:hypothetical protein